MAPCLYSQKNVWSKEKKKKTDPAGARSCQVGDIPRSAPAHGCALTASVSGVPRDGSHVGIDTSSQGSCPQPPTGIRPDCSILFQKELCFDDELVLQQLRYTGMLETVRIRRSGYSAKYTFQVGCSRAHAWLPGILATSRKSASMEHEPGRLLSIRVSSRWLALLAFVPDHSFLMVGDIVPRKTCVKPSGEEGTVQADPCAARPFIEHLL